MKVEKIIFKRNGENITTSPTPFAPFQDGLVDLEKEDVYCLSWDNDMLVKGKVYEVRDVELPEWLSAAEYCRRWVDFKYLWGMGADMEWSENWQRGLLKLKEVNRYVAIKLLKTKKFRSEFRQAMCERLINWMFYEEEQERFDTPWTPNMAQKLITGYDVREYKDISRSLYYCR